MPLIRGDRAAWLILVRSEGGCAAFSLNSAATKWTWCGWRDRCTRGKSVNSAALVGHKILIVEDEPLIALDLRTALEAAGAEVVYATSAQAHEAVTQPKLSAAVLDARPGSDDHRPIARRLRQEGVPFLFYSTHAPEDVTTVRGAPVILKPEHPAEIVGAVVLLLRDSISP